MVGRRPGTRAVTLSASPWHWWSPLVVAMVYTVASWLGSAIVSTSKLRTVTASGVGWALLAGLVAAVILGPLASRLPVPTWQRAVALFLFAWIFLTASNTIEVFLYLSPTLALKLPVSGAVAALGLAISLALAYPPPQVTTTLPTVIRVALTARPLLSWCLRWVLLAVSWVPVYLMFVLADGALFLNAHLRRSGSSPFSNLSELLIVEGQLVRGALHVVALFMLVALLGGERRRLALWLPAVIAVLNAWVPLIRPVPGFDTATRIANLLEITCDAVVFGLLATALLGWSHAPSRWRGACGWSVA